MAAFFIGVLEAWVKLDKVGEFWYLLYVLHKCFQALAETKGP